MEKSISLSNLEKFNKEFNLSKTKKIARNALIRSDINNIAMDWNGMNVMGILEWNEIRMKKEYS